MYTETNIAEFINYWNTQFPVALQSYYTDWLTSIDDKTGCIRNVILSAKHKIIKTDEYFFSASMYYMTVIPQIICKIASPKAARAFLNSSGWPAISLGLGGFMSAEQVLYESELLPYRNEVNKYISLLKITLDFQKQELVEYMSGNADTLDKEAHITFCEETKGLQEEILNELDRLHSYFINVCLDIKVHKEHSWESMYLDNNCNFYE